MYKILIVDDEEAIRFAMSCYFTTIGCLVDCAESVAESHSFLSAGAYSAVIADLRLSDFSDLGGLEVLRSARELHSTLPVVIMSAYASDEIEREVERLGASALVRKPKPLSDIAQIVFAMVEAIGEQIDLRP